MATGLGLFAGIPVATQFEVTTSVGATDTVLYTVPTNKLAYIQLQWGESESGITWSLVPKLRMTDTFVAATMVRDLYTAALAIGVGPSRTAFDSLTYSNVKPSSTERLDNNFVRFYSGEKLTCIFNPSANNGSRCRIQAMIVLVG